MQRPSSPGYGEDAETLFSRLPMAIQDQKWEQSLQSQTHGTDRHDVMLLRSRQNHDPSWFWVGATPGAGAGCDEPADSRASPRETAFAKFGTSAGLVSYLTTIGYHVHVNTMECGSTPTNLTGSVSDERFL